MIDLHTGYGERAKLHFLPGNVQEKKRKALLEVLFKDIAIDWPNTEKQFIMVRGGFRDYVGNLIPDDKKYIGTVLEFGTLNSHKTVYYYYFYPFNTILNNFVPANNERILYFKLLEVLSSGTKKFPVNKRQMEFLIGCYD